MLSRKNSLFAGSLPAVISAARLHEPPELEAEYLYIANPAKLKNNSLSAW
jgi:hypothetical protein